MRLLLTSLAIACGLMMSAALADPGRYVTATVGFNTLGDQDVSATIDGASATDNVEFDGSFLGGGGIGFRFDNNFAVEGEFLYRTVSQETVTLGAIGTFDEGNYASTQLNVNAKYFFNLFGDANIETYVGAGLAYLNEIDIDLEDSSGEREFETDEMGFELLAGARYPFGERGFVDAGIRYLNVGDITMEQPDNSANTVSADYDPFAVTVSFGWRF